MTTFEVLLSKELRPGRVYEGDLQASRCGRVLGVKGEPLRGSVVCPNGLVVTTEADVVRLATEAGVGVLKIEALTRRAVEGVQPFTPTQRQAVAWLLEMKG